MKLVRAILKPERAIILKDELQSDGYHGITSKEVKGYGENKEAVKQIFRGNVFEHKADSVKRIEIELVVSDENYSGVIETIRNIGKTGNGSDGRIYTIALEDSIHIDSGSRHVGEAKEEEGLDI